MKHLNLLLSLLLFYICSFAQAPDPRIIHLKSPESFKAKFKTTKGDFVIEAKREWSPAGVDRLYQLISSEFYKNISIFRVQAGYIAQFGISDNKQANNFWVANLIEDEPVILKNRRGSIHFAHGGPGDRTHQLFVNLIDNTHLDTALYQNVRGFPGIAKIIEGIEVIDQFYSEYGFEPSNKQDSIYNRGSAYLKENYPELDYILEVILLNEE